MSKHEFKVATTRRAEVITPEVVESKVPTHGNRRGNGVVLSSKDISVMVTGAVEIARMMVSSKADIAKINANADADVARIRAQIEKLTADTRVYVEKARAENEVWHSQFDKKAAELKLARDWVTKQLNEFGDCSDEVKVKIIDLALCQFK